MHIASYNIMWSECTPELFVIRDVGPHDRFRTVTNDAEGVVARLLGDHLRDGRRLFYYDSQGEYSEIVWQGVKHIEFRPAERSTA